MRIGEIARLSGISARSIRHYHRIGILTEPARTRGGYRQYKVEDLLRVMRIGFLASSGLPLRDIPAILSGGDATTDLDTLRSDIDIRIQSLTRQRQRLDIVAERAAAGLPVGQLPSEVARALNACAADAADDPALLAVIEREQDLLDLLALSAQFPHALSRSYATIAEDPNRRAAYLELLAGFEQIAGHPIPEVETEIARLAATLGADPVLCDLVASPPPGPHEGPTLAQLVPDPAHREVIHRVLITLGADTGRADQ
ncbi:hypothetical protein DQ226_16665 [Dietzia maris]|uniref:HTH merR-type domain-containing protein n=1 Tax=Dietzia maris TaxID=37915 RepID=A0A365P6N6_9ACTN|nr:hypothetical protein DQ226_16665 [Dietzia maris]